MEFFRFCPGCGKRFHITLVNKKLVAETKSDLKMPVSRTNVAQFEGVPILVLGEGRPIVADIKEFQYTYRCNHCGHQWSEKHVKEDREN